MRKLPIILVISVILAVVIAAVVLGRQTPVSSDQIRIAANLPLSGPLSVYGVSVREGVEQYIIDNPDSKERLGFDWQDNASDPATAVRIASRQLEGQSGPPDVYISGVKPQTMAIADAVAASGVPHFVWIFDPIIRTSGAQNFRTWVSYKIEPEVYLDFLRLRDADSVAIAYVQLPHTIEEFETILLPSLDEMGIEYSTQVFEFGRTDFRDIARNLVSTEADVIILNGFQLELAAMVRALRQEPDYDASRIIGTYDMLDAAEVLSAEEIEGISVVTPMFSTTQGEQENSDWTNRFMAQWDKPPLYTHAFAYDMAQIIDEASKQNQGLLFERINSSQIEGITGPLSFDADGDLITPLHIGEFRNGEVVVSD